MLLQKNGSIQRQLRNTMVRLLCIVMCAIGQQQSQPQPSPRLSTQQSASASDMAPIPVVFVSYGELPLYLRLNIELTARYNDVIVISDVNGIEHFDWASNSFPATSQPVQATVPNAPPTTVGRNGHRIVFESLGLFENSANQFAPLYKHLSRDMKPNRVKHELRCFQRWFILQVRYDSTA